jgi:hypothetical protein
MDILHILSPYLALTFLAQNPDVNRKCMIRFNARVSPSTAGIFPEEFLLILVAFSSS